MSSVWDEFAINQPKVESQSVTTSPITTTIDPEECDNQTETKLTSTTTEITTELVKFPPLKDRKFVRGQFFKKNLGLSAKEESQSQRY